MRCNISTKDKSVFTGRIHLPQCQSSNDELLALLTEKGVEMPEGFVVSTDYQSAGRGQRGNQWIAEPGKNLLFSILLRPVFLDARFSFQLSAALVLGISKALENLGVHLKLKWPNDLFLNGRKLGGILVETAITGNRLERAVCGIGLNINQKNPGEQAISLYDAFAKEFDREELLGSIYSSIIEHYHRLSAGEWPSIRSAYLSRLHRLAEPAWYRLPDGHRFRAVLKSVSEEGELILLSNQGEKRFRFKEVIFETDQD